jgi:plasmid stabilization system protein ParE
LKLRITEAAEGDIRDAFRWYRGPSPGLGREFRASLNECLERVSRDPLLYAVIMEPVRRALLKRFPYGVFYLLEPEEVVVLGVFHARRDPAVWTRGGEV